MRTLRNVAIGVCSGVLIALSSAAGATGSISIGGTDYIRGGNSEEVHALFGPVPVHTMPDNTPAVSTATAYTYSGLVEIVVSGSGESLAQDDNDAFYVFAPAVYHDATYYQLAIDSTPILGNPGSPTPFDQLAKQLIVFDFDAPSLTPRPPGYVPEYRADHTYRFVIDLSRAVPAPTTPSQLHFGVADGQYWDNTGAFTINVYQLVEESASTPGEAVLLQIGPVQESGLFGAAARVSGGEPNSTPTIELLAASSCTAGQLGGDAAVFDSVQAPLDGNGEGLVIAPVNDPPAGSSHAAARLAGSTAAPSTCIVVSPDNDSWTRALALSLSAAGSVSVADADGFIDSAGKSRWYKFAIQPGAKATITLSGLPADYDLAVFKDIAQAYQALDGDDDVAGLNRLGAEFAPSVFSPSVFSPSVFSPSVFSADAYAPSVFSPDEFSPSVFSPSVFSPSVFSPSVFSPSVFSAAAYSPSVFSPSVFSDVGLSPSVFSPSVFSPEDFASAQIRSLIAVSAQVGTGTERVVADTWNNTGFFYVRVAGKNGAASDQTPFELTVELDGTQCTNVAPLENPTPVDAMDGDYQTIILWDSSRLMSAGNTFAQIAPLEARLNNLAARPEVKGVVVDLGTMADVQLLHAQADAESSCPYAVNLTAQRIKDVVDAYRSVGNPLAYVVIAGGDSIVPFFRYPDQGLLGPEQDYDPPVRNGTQSQSALRLNYVLGQDEYGAATTLSLRDGVFPLPDLAVGRLVETVPEMIGVLDAYLGTPSGVVPTPTSTLVTGYDFLTDAATAVQAELVAGTVAARNDTLITAADISPDDPRSWTATDLRRELLNQGEDIIFLAGHFSANSALAADYKTTAVVTELAASSVDLKNALVFSAGCHSGYNIVNGHAVPGVTLPLDWTQAFAQKGATLVAGTGYQYGDTDFVEYSERLYVLFAQELRTGIGPISVGNALVRAKQRYLATTPDVRGLHRKSVLISTVFGLPMLKVNMPGQRLTDASSASIVPGPYPVVGGPGAVLGLEAADVTFGPGDIPLVDRTVPLTVLGGGSLTATYLTGPDGVVTNPAEPALPLASIDVSVDQLSLRGVGLRSGSWSERQVVPLTGAPTTELRGVHTPFASLVNFPMRLATPNYYGAISGDGRTLLNVTPAQHRVANIGNTLATLRQFSELGFRLYYSNNTVTFDNNATPALSGPPALSGVRTQIDGNDVLFFVNAVGDPVAGMQAVWVTYTEGMATSGEWVSLDLARDPADSRLWTGRLVDGAVAFNRLDFLVQAVNGVGLLSVDDNYGRYYQLTGQAGAGLATALELGTTATSGKFGSQLALEAQLTQGGAGVDGAPVLFTLGGTSRVATTDGNGFASVLLPVNATPGQYLLTASFAGDANRLPASDDAPFTVLKAGTSLTLQNAPQSVGVDNVESGLSALLRDEFATPLPQRTVYFTLAGGPDGSLTVAAITDKNGVAKLGAVALPPQIYGVTARYLGVVPTPAGPLTLDNPVYAASSATTSLNLIGGVNCPRASVKGKIDVVGFCYLVHKVDGKVSITNGTLIVGGSSVIVDSNTGEETTTTGGIIDQKIDQLGSGSVVVHASASVRGQITEGGIGDIVVNGSVGGNLNEAGPGNIEISATGIVSGNVNEADDGSLTVNGRTTGHGTEAGAGDLIIGAGGIVGGNATENGAGTLINGGTVTGQARQY